MTAALTLALTSDHIARITRKVEDSGAPPGISPQTDADYQDWVDRMLGSHPAPDKPGLMMALDQGESCEGMLFELPDRNLERRTVNRDHTPTPIMVRFMRTIH